MEWLVDDREQVRRGQPICVLETSKSAVELESPGEGTLCHLARAGEEVALGACIGAIATTPEEIAALESVRASEPRDAEAIPTGRATRKAIELAAEHGIDLGTIAAEGFITAADVAALVGSGGDARTAADVLDPRLLHGVPLDHVTLPECLRLDGDAGVLDPGFLETLRGDPELLLRLSPDERCESLRRHGADIGDGVRLGERTLIAAPRIVLGDGVEIGDGSVISCEEAFCTGPLTMFGPRFRLRCRRAFFGAGGYVGEDVQIGGGGAGDPQAAFIAGDLLFIGAEVFVNPCRPVVIGREVFLTMRSIIVTHNIGHSAFEGFENRFAPVVLEDRAQVGIGAVVYAGCRVGRESIVGSNSYVVSDIPPGKLATGVPARVVGEARHIPSAQRRRALAAKMMDDLRELLELRGHRVALVADSDGHGLALEFNGQTSRILFIEHLDSTHHVHNTNAQTVVLTLDLDGAPPSRCTVLDLLDRRIHGPGGAMADVVREFCRKRGIRFEPGPWRYRGGLI